MGTQNPRILDPAEVSYGPDGLVAAVVQDADDGRVLMVAWQDAEAVEATIASGEAHFHSRSRDALWKKGETSGNTLAVVSLELDCDADAVLITARPAGPTCHTEARSCFDLEPAADGAEHPPSPPPARTSPGWSDCGRPSTNVPERDRRARTRAGCSTTAWTPLPARSAEEATEVVMAAKDDDFAQRSGVPSGHARSWPGSWPICSITRWCCARSVACRPRRSSTRSRVATRPERDPAD